MADPTLDSGVTLLGSAATPWASDGCRCRECLSLDRPPTASALRMGAVTVYGNGISVAGDGPAPVAAGTALERAGVRVIGLPMTPGVALVIVSAAGSVLWAPTAGDLPEQTLEALRDARLDVAALAVGGEGGERGEGTAPTRLAHALARLRGVRALADDCDVVAVGLNHRNGPRLAPLLTGWGARVAADGAPLGRRHQVPRQDPARRTLVLGPARSGKSAAAEAMLAADAQVDYLPTGPADTSRDGDWAARVAAHRRRRPPWWRTLEAGDLAAQLASPGPPLLVDSLGMWVAGALERSGAWDDAQTWRTRFEAEVDTVVQAWRQTRRRVVGVGEETGWGVIPASSSGRLFRDELGTVTRRLAAESERVLLVVAGRTVELGGATFGG